MSSGSFEIKRRLYPAINLLHLKELWPSDQIIDRLVNHSQIIELSREDLYHREVNSSSCVLFFRHLYYSQSFTCRCAYLLPIFPREGKARIPVLWWCVAIQICSSLVVRLPSIMNNVMFRDPHRSIRLAKYIFDPWYPVHSSARRIIPTGRFLYYVRIPHPEASQSIWIFMLRSQ